MSTVAPMPPASTLGALDEVPPYPVRRFSVAEYQHLAASGFFDDDPRYELLEGWIVPKMTMNPPHPVAVSLADDALRRLPLARWHLRVQSSVVTLQSVPEPDLAIVRGVPRDYLTRHPEPHEIALAVEVSDSSLAKDRVLKARIYARAGIPAYWIVNLAERQVEVFTEPSGPVPEPSYRSARIAKEGEQIAVSLDGIEVGHIAVADLLP